MNQPDIAVEMKNISKYYSGICAVSNVNLKIRSGTIHALIGENGAGKSTLMRVLCGIAKKDSGQVFVKSQKTEIKSLIEAQNYNIAIVPQELALVEYFTVAENIFLGREALGKYGLVSQSKMNRDAAAVLEKLKIKLDPKAYVRDLSVSQKQMLVIAKVLSLNAEIIIMDEPTARLGVQEIDDFLNYMIFLKECGKTIIYISHKLNEIFRICDEMTVLRDGKAIGYHKVDEITEDILIQEMVNRSTESLDIKKQKKNCTEEILRAENVSCANQVKNVSFNLMKGEILGFYGLVGAGRTEAIRAILGIDKMDAGKIIYKGKEVRFRNVRESMKAGIALIPEERRQQGLIMSLPVRKNISLTKLKSYSRFGFLNQKKEKEDAKKRRETLRIACSDLENPAGSLSGGNQQKVVLAKFIGMPLDIYIFDEPTRGIDVGAKSEIYTLIEKISESGASVIIISSEIPEIQSICDRVAVVKEGEVVKILDASEFKEAETILKYSIGG